MISRIAVLIFLVLTASAFSASAGIQEKETAAALAAEKWLGMVDGGKYGESWSDAAEFFRNAITQEQWEHSLQAVRKPLGKLRSRTIKTKTFTRTLPGAPDGEYVVIQFESSFTKKRSAIETVTPMLEDDGKWRVSGYFIR
jgi:hypothetical protein